MKIGILVTTKLVKSLIGTKVKIYSDPITMTSLEGEAIVRKVHGSNGMLIDADVEFSDGTYRRFFALKSN